MTLQVTPTGDINSDTENLPTEEVGGGAATLTILDEGTTVQTGVHTLDFIGDTIEAASVSPGRVSVTVSGAGGGGAIYFGVDPPANPLDWVAWWNTEEGALKVWYKTGDGDPDSSQWVDAMPHRQGPAGDDGNDGDDGNTLLSGSGAPSSGLGGDGDFYIDTDDWVIYGPKTSGSWPSGVALNGLPTGGAAGDVLGKLSSTDYDVDWITTSSNGVYPLMIPPSAGDFTATISTGQTLTDKSDRMQVTVTRSATTNIRCSLFAVPSTPYTIDFCGGLDGNAVGGSVFIGIALSDGTKIITLFGGRSVSGNQGPLVNVNSYTNNTTISANLYQQQTALPNNFNWYRITSDGANRVYFVSMNGKDYLQLFTHAEGTFLTTSHIGIAMANVSSDTVTAKGYVTHFVVSGSVLGDAG